MLLLEVIVCLVAIALLVPVLILFSEILIALLGRNAAPGPSGSERPNVVLIIPAHNESSGICDTITQLLPQLQTGDRLLVVADNCTDNTADLARAVGAEVVTRKDPVHRGKGYALEAGVRYLEDDPPAAVLMVDADCRVTAGSIELLARLCVLTGRPVQALNLSHAPPGSGFKMRIAAFASVLKNQVRPLGLHRLGLSCQLTGTGMAFPWGCVRKVTLATDHIVEDLKLGLQFADEGYPPIFCAEAQVTSYFPSSDEDFLAQRTRWEHGYLGVLTRDAPAVFMKSLATRNLQLLALCLDLCVPPLALLAILATAVWIASALMYAVMRMAIPMYISSAAIVLLTLSVMTAWARFGRGVVSVGSLALGIAYVFWKIPIYARFVSVRQLKWVRAKRDDGRSA